MSFYFRGVPNFEYIDPSKDASISDYVQVKNLFRKNRIREDIFGNITYFTKYNVIGNERPDQIAEKFYDDPTLDWVVLLANNIVDVRNEWPLDNYSFNEAMIEKYKTDENLYAVHHYETMEVKNSLGVTILPAGLNIGSEWKTNGNFVAACSKPINQIFCGDGVTPTSTVTVTMNDGLKKLKVGNEVTISNVTNSAFNGTFKVTSVFIPFDDEIVYSFTYQLPSIPNVVQPALTTDNRERVTVVVYDGSIGANVYYFEYYDQGTMIRVGTSAFLKTVTNYEYELNLNNKKREIFVLKPNYLGIILNDAESASSYKVGGVQYVDDKLKRGDNIRVYS